MASSRKSRIENLVLHSVTGGLDDSFVGLKYIGNRVHIYYPECYHLEYDSDTIQNDIMALLRTVSIAKTTSLEHSKAYNTQNEGGDFALFSYLWIINDFLSRGFYVNREKTYKTNQNGKINWKKTMQLDPIVSSGNIVFPNVIVEKKSETDDILVEVHKYCVKKSIDYIGWLFNIKSDFIQVPQFTEGRKKLYLNAVKQELNHTFIDDKKVLLTHMKNVIEGLDETSNNKDFVYGVDSYYYIFERMIDSIFSKVDEINNFYPAGWWALDRDGYEEFNSSKLRPDTVILMPNENGRTDAFILDSKFYRFGYTGNTSDLPETTSIHKQITYGEFIKDYAHEKYNIDNVYNAFLIPYDSTRDEFKPKSDDDKIIQYVGYAKSDWKDNMQDHEIVHTFLIDLKHVIHTWNGYNHDNAANNLVAQIKKQQENYKKRQENYKNNKEAHIS